MSQPSLFFTFKCIEDFNDLFIAGRQYQGYFCYDCNAWEVVSENDEIVFVLRNSPFGNIRTIFKRG